MKLPEPIFYFYFIWIFSNPEVKKEKRKVGKEDTALTKSLLITIITTDIFICKKMLK